MSKGVVHQFKPTNGEWVEINQESYDTWAATDEAAGRCQRRRLVAVAQHQGEAAVVIPADWKLVPIQPTPEMLKAVDDEADDKHLARGRAISAWGLMLDATPKPSVADIEPFAVVGDYAACGGNRTVFTPEYADLITDRMCSKTPVYTLGAVGAAVAAINTLNAKGYTYHGAALWKPPVGEKPDFDLIDGARAGGIELAAKWVEARASAYDHEHGSTDPETGTREYPGTGGEYVYELHEIADGIRTLSLNAKVGAEVGDE